MRVRIALLAIAAATALQAADQTYWLSIANDSQPTVGFMRETAGGLEMFVPAPPASPFTIADAPSRPGILLARFQGGEQLLIYKDTFDEFLVNDKTYRADPKDIETRQHIFAGEPDAVIAAYKKKIDSEKRAAKIAADKASAMAREARQRAEQEKLARGPVKIGMSVQQVIASSWGAPLSTRRVTTSTGVTEYWSYMGGNQLVFSNGKLAAIYE